MRILDHIRKRINPVKYYKKRGVVIGEGTVVFNSVIFDSEPYLIEIGSNSKISSNVRFVTHDGGVFVIRNIKNVEDADIFGKIKIGNNVFIGNNATIMPRVTVGNNVIVGYGSIVTKDIPDNEVWAGIPAKRICSIEEYYKKNEKRILMTKKMDYKAKKKYILENIDKHL